MLKTGGRFTSPTWDGGVGGPAGEDGDGRRRWARGGGQAEEAAAGGGGQAEEAGGTGVPLRPAEEEEAAAEG